MQIFVDADACPVVDIIEKIAEKYNIKTTLLCDTNHVLYSDYSEVIVVGAGADAVSGLQAYKPLPQGRYRCITGLWSCCYGTGQRRICNPPIRQVVHRRKHRPDADGEAP